MIALIIIIALLVLILLLPVGAEVSFIDGALTVKARLGPIKLRLVPGKKPKKEKPPKPPKVKPPKDKESKKKKQPLTKDDIFQIARLGLKALARFRKALSIDVLMLHLTAGAADPCDAVELYGKINAALGVLHPLLHRAVKIRNEDIATAVAFDSEKTAANVRVAATLQIWEILHIALCAGFGLLAWMLKRRKRARLKNANLKSNGSEKGT